MATARRPVPPERSEKSEPRVSLRTRLALVFVAATLVPLGATLWLTSFLLDQSLRLRPVDQISSLSRSLEKTGREYYRQACEQLKADALAGRASPRKFAPGDVSLATVEEFRNSEESERFVRTGDHGSVLQYLARTSKGVSVWERPLTVRMQDLA